ncbi:MAG: TetR/AcrR family transcriptional regulator [Desulfatiglandaceae bacterium]
MARRKYGDKLQEIEKTAAYLFAQKGYPSTTMREIARDLGMNQASLYYYFKSKEDILFKLVNDAMDNALERLEAICASLTPPEEKLDEAFHYYTRYYAGDQVREVLLLNEMKHLGADYRQGLIEKERRYVHLMRSILMELDAEGRMKDIHPTVAIFAFFGMVHFTVRWYHKDGPVGLEDLAATFVEIFTRGVLR